MAKRKEQFIEASAPLRTEDELRLLPFLFAGLICFTIAVILGTGSWLVFGSRSRVKLPTTAETSLPANAEPSPMPETIAPVVTKPRVEGVVEIAGGEIALGGGETKMPVTRVAVRDFSIAETEVTNAQYAEFIKETGHAAPPVWKNGTFPKGEEDFPVTNVSYEDALAFCRWLEKKIGYPVRLPNEAEWELAARGAVGNRYPWGNDWNSQAVISKENGGKISAVKSFPLNRSPFGAFDMAGNVWEWTRERVEKNEKVTDQAVREALEQGLVLRVVKGGSSLIPAEQISAQARYEIPEDTKVPSVGFRYVVERKN